MILTTFGRPGYLRRALESGAAAFLVKYGPIVTLAVTIRRVQAGERVIEPDLAATALSEGPNPLTEREQDVMRAASGGADVAAQRTVRNHLSFPIQNFYVHNYEQAIHVAIEEGL